MKPKHDYAAIYNQVVNLVVDQRLTIQQACKLLKVTTALFYKSMTPAQKLELRQLKAANNIYGISNRSSNKPKNKNFDL